MKIALLVTLCLAALTESGLSLSSKTGSAVNDIRGFEAALRAYALEYGRYPTAEEGLRVLTEAIPSESNPRGIVFYEGNLDDPWGRPYQYVPSTGTSEPEYRVFSFGPDGISLTRGRDPDDLIATSDYPKQGDFDYVIVVLYLVPLAAICGVLVLALRELRKLRRRA